MAIQQFEVAAELQQFLQGVGSRALTNVLWNMSFTDDAPLLPMSTVAVRRSLLFDKEADGEFDCFIVNLDGTDEVTITTPREFP